MGLLDTLKGLFGKAQTLAEEHPDQVKSAMTKAEGLIDDKTDHKFSSQIQAGGDKAAEFLDGKTDQPPAS
jgi:MT0933-like antitoxin protein